MNIQIPYFQFYACEYLANSRALSDKQIREVLDYMSDICMFGSSNVELIHIAQKSLADAFSKGIAGYIASVKNGGKGGRPKKNLDNNPSINLDNNLNDNPDVKGDYDNLSNLDDLESLGFSDEEKTIYTSKPCQFSNKNPSYNPDNNPEGKLNETQEETNSELRTIVLDKKKKIQKKEKESTDKISSLSDFEKWDFRTDQTFQKWFQGKRENTDFAKNTFLTNSFIGEQKEAVILYCKSSGRSYKDYVSALQNFINSEIKKRGA